MKNLDFVRNVLALAFGAGFIWGFATGKIDPTVFTGATVGIIGYVFYVKQKNQPKS